MNYPAYRQAIYDWAAANGPAPIWLDQNAPRPVRPYATLKLSSSVKIGHDSEGDPVDDEPDLSFDAESSVMSLDPETGLLGPLISNKWGVVPPRSTWTGDSILFTPTNGVSYFRFSEPLAETEVTLTFAPAPEGALLSLFAANPPFVENSLDFDTFGEFVLASEEDLNPDGEVVFGLPAETTLLGLSVTTPSGEEVELLSVHFSDGVPIPPSRELYGDREVTLAVQIFGAPGYDSLEAAEKLAFSLNKIASRATLNQAGVWVADVLSISDLAQLRDPEFENRAALDILLRVRASEREEISIIERTEITGITDPGPGITLEVQA